MNTPLNERKRFSARAVKVYSSTQSGMILGLSELQNKKDDESKQRKEWRNEQRNKKS